MRTRSKIILSSVAAILCALIAVVVLLETINRPFRNQMNAGREFMDSLTSEDIQAWTARAETLLLEHDPSDPIPEDLQAIKVFRITLNRPDYISFDWMGGMDHTQLEFRKTPEGIFKVTAVYSDYEQRQLWPLFPPES